MEPWNFEGGRLLIVHGVESSLETLSRRLQEAGHTTIVAQNGRHALSIVSMEAPDLVILDVHAPQVDGEQFLTALKADGHLTDIPVILLAPAGEVDVVERCLALGAEDFLFAPFSPTPLKAQVRDYLQISRRRRQERQLRDRETLLKMERDLQTGRSIQAGFLPSELPQPEGWEVAVCFDPAREVAGDFYDAFTLTQGRRIGLVIADICDKGVGAALFMALVRSLIRAYAQHHYSIHWTDVLDEGFVSARAGRQRLAPSTGTMALKNAMDLTNEYIVSNHAESTMFATVFFAVLDPASGQVTYVNGGHNPPAIIGMVDGQLAIKARLMPTGPAVGMFPGVDFKIGQMELAPGDTLFSFTDGVTDAKNPNGERFGEERMLDLILQPTTSVKSLLDRVHGELCAHITDCSQFDDITMLAVQRRPEL